MGDAEIVYQRLAAYLPSTWMTTNEKSTQQIELSPYTHEFNVVAQAFPSTPRKIMRHQNVNQYGLFLIRQQQLQTLEPHTQFFKVKRYCTIPINKISVALSTNLDDRRLECGIVFQNSPAYCRPSTQEVVLVVSMTVNSANFNSNNKPSHDSDIFIDYIVYY